MKTNLSVLLLATLCCFLFATTGRATDHAYGYTSIYVDSGNVVRGYHRTEVDYNTDVYYTPYVCGSLYKDGLEVTRTCGGGFASATKNTQTAYYAGSSYSALSDHYVDIDYQEEDPYNPGYYYYPDNLGYFFSGGGSQPIDWYYVASGIYNQRPDESINLGNTHAESPITFIDVSEIGTTNRSDFFGGIPATSLSISSCGGERFGIKIRFWRGYTTSVTNFNSTVTSGAMFQIAPSPIDGSYVEYYGNDNPHPTPFPT